MLKVLGCPPVSQLTLGVESAALRIEGVAYLVPDDRADGGIVHGVRRLWIKERRLKNGGRGGQRVLHWKVVGIPGLRRHAPLATGNLFSDSRNPQLVFQT